MRSSKRRGKKRSKLPALIRFFGLPTTGLANREAAHASVIAQLGIAWARAASGLFGMSETCENYTVSRRYLMLPRKHCLLLGWRRCLLAADMNNRKAGPTKILAMAKSPRSICVGTQTCNQSTNYKCGWQAKSAARNCFAI